MASPLLEDDMTSPLPLSDAEHTDVRDCLACFVHPEQVQAHLDRLRADLTAAQERKDGAYLERNQVVSALSKVFPSGVARTAIEGWSEDWHGCVYIDSPAGQLSWHFHDSQAYLFEHLPPYRGKWDGHTTEEKYARLAQIGSGLAERLEKAEAALRGIVNAIDHHHPKFKYGPFTLTSAEIEACRAVLAAPKEEQG